VKVAAAPPVNGPPVAAFDYSCVDLTCAFTDRSGDSDGVVSAWAWAFGSAGTAATASPSFRFPSAGTYEVSLTVTDDRGASSTATRTVTVTAAVHAAFLATTTTGGGNATWKATVVLAVHAADEQPVPGATVAVSWTGGWNQSASCVTGTTGQCTFKTGAMKSQQASATMTITSVAAAGSAYNPAANHSQVAGATATAVTVIKP